MSGYWRVFVHTFNDRMIDSSVTATWPSVQTRANVNKPDYAPLTRQPMAGHGELVTITAIGRLATPDQSFRRQTSGFIELNIAP